MNRFMQIFNFFGVMVLAGLCTLQWKYNSQMNTDLDHLNQVSLEQTDEISKQDKTIKDDASDLDDFRQRLSTSEATLKDTQTQLAAATTKRDQLAAEVEQRKANLETWKTAVADRTALLQKASDRIQAALSDRNQAVQKFNDIVSKYNAIVKEMNDKQGK